MTNRFLLFFSFLLVTTNGLQAQVENVIGAKYVVVPEKEVDRQSAFVDANQKFLLGDFDEAIILLDKFLYDNPKNDGAWYLLARNHAMKKSYDKALYAIQQALTLDAANRWYSILLADIYEATGRIGDAVTVYEGLVKRFNQVPEFYEKLGYLQVLGGNPKAGIKTYQMLEQFAGITEVTTHKKHLIYVAMNDYNAAAAEYKKLIQVYPDEVTYRYTLAQFYEKIGDAQNAKAVYQAILQRNPDDSVARLGAMDKGKGAASGNDMDYLQKIAPLFADPTVDIDRKIKELVPYLNKVTPDMNPTTLQSMLQLTDALLKTHPKEAKAWSVAGDINYLAGKNDEALKQYKTCIDLQPTVFSVWENMMNIYLETENFTQLKTIADKSIDAFPNQAKGYYFFGVAANSTGKPQEAIPMLQQAQMIAGNNMPLKLTIIDELSVSYLQQKNFEKAAKLLEDTLPKGGEKHKGILQHLGDALNGLGKNAEAKPYWDKSKAMD